MVNYLWAFFFIIGILYSFFTGKLEIINDIILNSANTSLEMILKMIPLMCLWLGLMNIAKKSSLLDIVAKKLTPFLKKIFPEIPDGHEALGYIASNIAVNMVGLSNAATPFGLKAMKSLNELNKEKDTATRSMITFLVINTASVTLIPTTVISFRMLNGSTNPTEIVGVCIITTIISCFIGILIDRLFYLFSGSDKK